MELHFASAAERPLDALVDTFNTAFEGYVGGLVRLDRGSFASFLARQRVDLRASRVAVVGDRTQALALVARRGNDERLAAMGVRPEVAGQGVGTGLMEDWFAAARARGVRRLELEVIERNPPGLALYRKTRFREVQRLLEFHREPGAAPPSADADPPDEIDPAEVARAAVAHGDPELPWPVSGFDLVSAGAPSRGFRLGPALALVTPPPAGAVRLEAVVVEPSSRGRGHGRALLGALGRRWADRPWHVVANCPERYRPFLEACGFAPGGLSQLHLRRELDGA